MTQNNPGKDTRELRIEVDGKQLTVARNAYVKAKTKQLREFGYDSLDEAHVSEQLDAILKGEKLTVIGMFMEKEIVKP